MKPTRIDKLLSDAGFGTRSEVKKLLRDGSVLVNGKRISSPQEKVTGEEEILCKGQRVKVAASHVYYLLNKPAGTLSATEDPHGKTVLDLLPKDPRRTLFPVGRLDKDTEGFLFITDDGDFAHALLSPKRHVDKTYLALVRPCLPEDAGKAIEEGMDIGDEKPTLPGRLEVLETKGEGEESESKILLTIQEGRYHQVKRMVAALGSEVVYLKRLSMGEYQLPPDLKPGEYLYWEEEPPAQIRKPLQ